ncbi:MAG: NAD(P)/FAD-dependent oxidoreductase [Fimbriimonadales bacterium]|nr:NAD(P)/FAD-dependent oxidoreductase [Fimbriimonadales bacterium]
MSPTDITIIGAGPTGLFGAFYAGLRGMTVRLIDSLPELGGQLTALYPEKYVYDMPGFPAVLARDLARSMAEQALRFRPEVRLAETALTLERAEDCWLLGTDRAAELPTRTLLITAGPGAFQPTRLGLAEEPRFEGRGLQYGVRRKADHQGRRVVVVGGGDSACDWALALAETAAQVTLVHRRDQFRAHEETVSSLRRSSVAILTPYTVSALLGDERLEGVEIERAGGGERRVLECDDLIVNIGFKSSLGPIKSWGIETQGNQIVVDAAFRTNLPGVFAAGDVCSHESKLKLIATGVGEAATAVCFAKVLLDPAAKLFPGHSSDRELPPAAALTES